MRRSLPSLAAVRGWRYERCGLPGKVLQQGEWAAPTLGEHDVRVKMQAVPVLAQDVQMVLGMYGGYKAEAYPAVAGTEGVGEVVEAGASSCVAKGTKVALAKQNVGSFATEVTTSHEHVIVLPKGLDAATQAVLPLYAAAVRMATDFGDVAGKNCVVLGADSPMGSALAAVLKSKGAKVDGKGAAAFVFNGVGGTALAAAVDAAADRATIVTFGNSSGEKMGFDGTVAVLKGLTMRSFWYNRWLQKSDGAERAATFEEAAAEAKSGAVKTKSYTFAQFADAFDAQYAGTEVPVVSA
eukprot:TRINITY_DN30188_c0_g1_i1.p1 TRINITY_DN30188_c0_g1~~TRINITY_DN30188_c0_g1_i1.p1  ORF type:complete len:296 (+),score=124.29 TRINITY_DN30188_c0_g1_i1:62-949(+)